MKKLKIVGFTLSEVLITLGIIGVIAAITIPIILQKVVNNATTAKVIQTYKILYELYGQLEQDSAPGDISGHDAFIINYDRNAGWETLKNYLPLADSKTAAQGCGTYFLNQNYNCLDGSGTMTTGTCSTANIPILNCETNRGLLKNGVAIAAQPSGTCSTAKQYPCVRFIIDTNGLKPPNTLGRDAFIFDMFYDGVFPLGSPNKSWQHGYVEQNVKEDCNTSTSGRTCAYKILTDRAINY